MCTSGFSDFPTNLRKIAPVPCFVRSGAQRLYVASPKKIYWKNPRKTENRFDQDFSHSIFPVNFQILRSEIFFSWFFLRIPIESGFYSPIVILYQNAQNRLVTHSQKSQEQGKKWGIARFSKIKKSKKNIFRKLHLRILQYGSLRLFSH